MVLSGLNSTQSQEINRDELTRYVAQKGLWREAIYRWEKAVEIDPSYAAAYNDLAIAYEHEGDLDKARKAAMHTAIWLSLSLFIGAFCAAAAALEGGGVRGQLGLEVGREVVDAGDWSRPWERGHGFRHS